MTGGPLTKCICQLCICGRHKCPHQRSIVDSDKPYGVSEYCNKFVGHKWAPVESCKPSHKPIEYDGQLQSTTTNRVDYVTHEIKLQPSCKKQEVYQVPKQAFESLSTYNKEYLGILSKPAKPIKPMSSAKIDGKFDGTPTYRSDYRSWDIEPRKGCTGKESSLKPSTAPFSGVPTYRSDYVPHLGCKRPESCKPLANYNNSDAKFSSMTDYRESYGVPDLSQRAKPIRNEKHIELSSAPMENMSTQRHDFVWKNASPTQSCKPHQRDVGTNEPFAKDTTNRTDYRQWPNAEKSKLINPHSNYRKPEGEISGYTTYRNDYVPAGIHVRQPIKKTDNKLLSVGPFNGTTNYKDDYRSWGVGPIKKVGSKDVYQPPQVPFEGQSLSKQHYVAHLNYPLTESCKPIRPALQTQEPFQGSTLYRNEFVVKRNEPCPSTKLNTDSSPYIFYNESENGHLLYRRISDVAFLSDNSPSQLAVAN